MSRFPPFPTRRPDTSQTTLSQPASGPGSSLTRPLQISRPASRPVTPSYDPHPTSSYASQNTTPMGPSRPQRSDRRGRITDNGTAERSSLSSRDQYRDSVSTTRSDMSGQLRSQQQAPSTSKAGSRQKATRSPSGNTDDGDEQTPTSLVSVMSAFTAAGSRRRAMTNGSDDFEYQRQRQEEIEAEKVRQQRIQERATKRRGTTRTGNIDAVLDEIKDGWEFVIEPDFNNVDLALQLLDESSSIGKDMGSFRRTKQMLSKALKGSVDKHYQAFAASLPHHAALLNHLSISQIQLSQARTALLESKEALGNKRADLVQLWSRGQTLEEMMKILDEIEHLKTVPDLLETLMSEKRLLQAAILLVRSLKIINKPDMLEIGAVSDLRSYLNGQETALKDILIDELQSHLYLKSFWCESRWSAYTPGQQKFPPVEFENETEDKSHAALRSRPASPSFRQTRLTRFLNDLSMRANDPPYDLNEQTATATPSNPPSSSNNQSSSNSNPEADSFTYMETLLESLAVLGKLGVALDNITQRLPGEIFSLVETTLDEVEERAEFTRRQNTGSSNKGLVKSDRVYLFATGGDTATLPPIMSGKGPFVEATALRLAALESSARHMDHEVLKDIFWTLYFKLDAVAQGLRVVSEVANRIGSRRDFRDSSGAKPGTLFPLTEVWSPIQAEIRTLIQDYITDEQRGLVSGRNPISSINEILREGKFSRDKGKSVFRFTDTDAKRISKNLKPHEEGLMRILKETMPGLVQHNVGDTLQNTLANPTDDRLLGIEQHHRLLIRPDTFHVTVLFQPTLAFLDRIVDVLPSGIESARASSSVLDEFVLKVYLPQLEEKVLDLFHQAVTGPESFQPDPLSSLLCSEPLVKASTQLIALINSLCAMLRTTPFHRENYSRLILGVAIQFYQRCSDRFQTLITIPASPAAAETRIALGAQWAQRSELTPCLTELLRTPEHDSLKQQQLCRQQTNIEIELLGRKSITKEDLIPSVRNLSALASLYRSVAWFAQELGALRSRSDGSLLSPTSPNGLEGLTGNTPFSPSIPSIPLSNDGSLQLPLSKEMTLRFQALLKTYEQLSGLILDTLRIDLRCRAIFYLEVAMRHGNYALTYEVTEPDPYIVDLNTDLVQCDDITSTSLPPRERHYVFTGLGHLMEHLLISNARLLRLPNNYGIKKMMRNMLALQQSIKTLTNDQQHTEFERAKQYYSLYYLTPQEMLDRIRGKQIFNFDEYKMMLGFQCGVNPAEGDAGVAKATDRNYNMYVIELHGLEMDNS